MTKHVRYLDISKLVYFDISKNSVPYGGAWGWMKHVRYLDISKIRYFDISKNSIPYRTAFDTLLHELPYAYDVTWNPQSWYFRQRFRQREVWDGALPAFDADVARCPWQPGRSLSCGCGVEDTPSWVAATSGLHGTKSQSCKTLRAILKLYMERSDQRPFGWS